MPRCTRRLGKVLKRVADQRCVGVGVGVLVVAVCSRAVTTAPVGGDQRVGRVGIARRRRAPRTGVVRRIRSTPGPDDPGSSGCGSGGSRRTRPFPGGGRLSVSAVVAPDTLSLLHTDFMYGGGDFFQPGPGARPGSVALFGGGFPMFGSVVAARCPRALAAAGCLAVAMAGAAALMPAAFAAARRPR